MKTKSEPVDRVPRPCSTRLLPPGLALLAILALAGCQEPPSWEAGRARAAVRDLKDVTKADRWAPVEFQAIEDGLRLAETELTLQGARWSFSRDYSRAIILFSAIPKEAEMVRAAAEARRKEAETQAREALDAIRTAIAHARATVLVVPVGDGGRAAVRLGEQVERSERRLNEVENHLAAGEFEKARDLAGELVTQVNDALRGLAETARH